MYPESFHPTELTNPSSHEQSQPSPHRTSLTLLCNNIGHTGSANDLLRKLQSDTKASLVLLQEPLFNRKNGRLTGWGANPNTVPSVLRTTSRVASTCVDSEIGNIHVPFEHCDSIAMNRVTWNGMHLLIVNLYLKPRGSITEELDALSLLIQSSDDNNVIIAGDFNSRSTVWGDTIDDARSEEVLAFASGNGLEIVANDSHLPTFVHSRNGESHIDLVLTKLQNNVSVSVCTHDTVTHDHRPLVIRVRMKRHKRVSNAPPVRRFNTKKADWTKFSDAIVHADKTPILDELDSDRCWEKVRKLITDAANACIPLKKPNKHSVRYWNQELTNLLRTRNSQHQRFVRARKGLGPNPAYEHQQYISANRNFKAALKKRKLESFKEFIAEQTVNGPWTIADKVFRDKIPALKSLVASNANDTVETTMQQVLNHFFPDSSNIVPLESDESYQNDDQQLTEQEIKAAVFSMSLDKAPGSDMITGMILRQAFVASPQIFNHLYKTCFNERCFPKAWKSAVVAVIPKPGKDSYTTMSSFRPISLLSVPGKVLDRLMNDRINHHMFREPGRTYPQQYGFRTQHSTEMAIADAMRFVSQKGMTHYTVFIALDFKSAFDTASHQIILKNLKDKRVPRNLIDLAESFFTDRTVHLHHESLTESKDINQGCPQGSISGPSFWNILLDTISDLVDSEDINIVCFADDTLAQVRDISLEGSIRKAELIIERVMDWCDRNRLTLNMDKTEVMLVSRQLRKNARENIPNSSIRKLSVTHSGRTYQITPVDKFRYLGVILDRRLCFDDHIKYISQKATKVVWQVARGAQHNWGYSAEIMKTLYERCIEPIICYAASVWGHRVYATIENRRKLEAVQRLMLIRTTRSYRTVSFHALVAITGCLPICMRITQLNERTRLLKHRSVEQRVSYRDFFHPASDHRKEYHKFDPERNMHPVTVFTDGSKNDDKVGCAFVVFVDSYEVAHQTFKLSSSCSVFQAELVAILQSLEFLSTTEFHEAAIVTDSMSSLQAIAGNDVSHPLVHSIKRKLIDMKDSMMITLYHTRAHAGTYGNEVCDSYAKEGSLMTCDPTYSLKPVATVKSEEKAKFCEQWQEIWTKSSTGRHSHKIIPDLKNKLPLYSLNYFTTQFITGHGAFGEYLKRFNVNIPSASCLCGQTDSNPDHVLKDCPLFTPNEIQESMNHNGITSWQRIFQSTELFEELIRISRTYVQQAKSHFSRSTT